MTDYYKKYLKYKRKYLNKKKISGGSAAQVGMANFQGFLINSAPASFIPARQDELKHTVNTGRGSILNANDIKSMNDFIDAVHNEFSGDWTKLTSVNLHQFIATMFRKWLLELNAQLTAEKKNKTITWSQHVDKDEWKDNIGALSDLTRLQESVKDMLSQHVDAKSNEGVTALFDNFVNPGNEERCGDNFRENYWEPYKASNQCFAIFSKQWGNPLPKLGPTNKKFNHQDLVSILTKSINSNNYRGTRPEDPGPGDPEWYGAYCYICGCPFVKKDLGGQGSRFSSPECEHILPFADALWYFSIVKSTIHPQKTYDVLAAEYAYAHKVCNGIAKKSYKVIRFDIQKNKYVPHLENFEKIAEKIWRDVCSGGPDADHFVLCDKDYASDKNVPEMTPNGWNHPIPPNSLTPKPIPNPTPNCNQANLHCPKAFKNRIKQNMSTKVKAVLKNVNDAYEKINTKFTQIPNARAHEIHQSWGLLKFFSNICSAGMADVLIGPEYFEKSLSPTVAMKSWFRARCPAEADGLTGGGKKKKKKKGGMSRDPPEDEPQAKKPNKRSILSSRPRNLDGDITKFTSDTEFIQARQTNENLVEIFTNKKWEHDARLGGDSIPKPNDSNILLVNIKYVAREMSINFFGDKTIDGSRDNYNTRVIKEMLLSNAPDKDIILSAYFKMRHKYSDNFLRKPVYYKEDADIVLGLFIEQIKLEYASREQLLDANKDIIDPEQSEVYDRFIGKEGQLAFKEFILAELAGTENKYTVRSKWAYTENRNAVSLDDAAIIRALKTAKDAALMLLPTAERDKLLATMSQDERASVVSDAKAIAAATTAAALVAKIDPVHELTSKTAAVAAAVANIAAGRSEDVAIQAVNDAFNIYSTDAFIAAEPPNYSASLGRTVAKDAIRIVGAYTSTRPDSIPEAAVTAAIAAARYAPDPAAAAAAAAAAAVSLKLNDAYVVAAIATANGFSVNMPKKFVGDQKENIKNAYLEQYEASQKVETLEVGLNANSTPAALAAVEAMENIVVAAGESIEV